MTDLRLLATLFALTIAAAPAALAQDDVMLPAIPAASFDALDAPSRALLRQAIDQFEAQRASVQGRELGIAYGRVGLHYLAHQQLNPAMVSFSNAASLDTTNHRWPYYLGLALSFSGNQESSIAQFGQSLRLNPDHKAAATRLGLALIDGGKASSARSLLEPLSQDGRNAAAMAGLGRLALASGDHRVAADWYEKAIALQPAATALHAPLAQAYTALGDTEAAARHTADIGDRLPVIEDPLVALLYAHREPSSQFVARGDQARDAGQVAQAAVFYDFATAVNPQDQTARARLDELRTRAPSSAPTGSTQPISASDFFERGVFYAAKGDDALAARDFEQAIAREPDDVGARVFLANSLMRQREFSDAAVQYGMASARDEENAELRFRQGLAWIAAGRCARAETALLAGYELDQTALRIVQAIARLYATCDVDDAKRATALKYAEVLYNAQPTLETAETLAMVLAANGKFEDAADYQRQAIFEGLKTGRAKSDPSLSDNLERYVNGKAVTQAWPIDHPIFAPSRPTPKG